MNIQNFTLAILLSPLSLFAQIKVSGTVKDNLQHPLSYVNIGIKNENIGTISSEEGAFNLFIPESNTHDRLTFSLAGYHEYTMVLDEFSEKEVAIQLLKMEESKPNTQIIDSVLIDERVGVKHHRPIIQFADWITESSTDIVEIAQLIEGGEEERQITSVNFFLYESERDSATFRINFYSVENGFPDQRIIQKSIIEKRSIRHGWLSFDLTKDPLFIQGNFIVALEIIPENQDISAINFDVKPRGKIKSFSRNNSQGQWKEMSYSYCLYVDTLRKNI